MGFSLLAVCSALIRGFKMAITSAKWEQTITGEQFIRVVIDGKEFQVPDSPDNFMRKDIAEWEKAGNVIQPYVPPVVDKDARNLAALNALFIEPGSIGRALGMVMFKEINKLRVLNGDPAYTMTQFKAALQAEMG